MSNQTKKYLQYGCGNTAPAEWENFDTSPTIRVQKIPFVGFGLAKNLQGFTFPANIKVENIAKGLKVENGSYDMVYFSHVLEHLLRADGTKALRNSWLLLKPGGVFRCVLPNLNAYVVRYQQRLVEGRKDAAHLFMTEACLGVDLATINFRDRMRLTFGNYQHLWMWDEHSFVEALQQAGFSNIRPCQMADNPDPMLALVERPSRYVDCLAYECIK